MHLFLEGSEQKDAQNQQTALSKIPENHRANEKNHIKNERTSQLKLGNAPGFI
jgi:hypothetical protein